MARDMKLSFLFGTGTLGTSTIVPAPGSGVVSYYGGFSPGAAATTVVSCPMAMGGWSKTSIAGRPPYAEDVPDLGGIVLPGQSSRNDLFAIVDATVSVTVTSQTFSVQASADNVNWVTVGTADTNVPTTTVAAGSAVTTSAATAAGLFTSGTHSFAVGDILYVNNVGTGTYGPSVGLAAAVVGQLVEVASVPSATTFTLRPLSGQPLPLVNNTMVVSGNYASNGTATIQFTKVRTTDIGRQFVIPIAPTARPYLRLACTSNGSAGGIILVRDAYIANSRIGAVV
jgi:hypothetical protein